MNGTSFLRQVITSDTANLAQPLWKLEVVSVRRLLVACWWPHSSSQQTDGCKNLCCRWCISGLISRLDRGVSDTVGHRSGVTLFHLGTGCPGSQLEAQSVCGPRAPLPAWKKRGNRKKKLKTGMEMKNWGGKTQPLKGQNR